MGKGKNNGLGADAPDLSAEQIAAAAQAKLELIATLTPEQKELVDELTTRTEELVALVELIKADHENEVELIKAYHENEVESMKADHEKEVEGYLDLIDELEDKIESNTSSTSLETFGKFTHSDGSEYRVLMPKIRVGEHEKNAEDIATDKDLQSHLIEIKSGAVEKVIVKK